MVESSKGSRSDGSQTISAEIDFFRLLKPVQSVVGQPGESVARQVEYPDLVQSHQGIVVNDGDLVVCQTQPVQVDELGKYSGLDPFQLVVGDGEDLHSGLAGEGFSVKA